MKKLIFILLLFITVEVRSQYIENKDTIITKDSLVAGKENWTIRSLKGTEYFPASTGAKLNGLKEGEWRDYNRNNNLVRSAEYKNGMKNGAYKEFYDYGGYVSVSETFRNDTLEGERITNNTFGKLRLKENYVHGKLDGERKIFFEMS